MPICYGGGIKTIEQAEKIISLGIEKIAISSIALENPDFISESSKRLGSQSIVVVLDVKKSRIIGKNYSIYTKNGTNKCNQELIKFCKLAESLGAGELVINSIDKDGKIDGYDFFLIEKIRKNVNIPITCLGGAGRIEDFEELFDKFGIIGAAAGSFFVFKGKFKAVLIQYPEKYIKDKLNLIRGTL